MEDAGERLEHLNVLAVGQGWNSLVDRGNHRAPQAMTPTFAAVTRLLRLGTPSSAVLVTASGPGSMAQPRNIACPSTRNHCSPWTSQRIWRWEPPRNLATGGSGRLADAQFMVGKLGRERERGHWSRYLQFGRMVISPEREGPLSKQFGGSLIGTEYTTSVPGDQIVNA